MNVEEKGQEYAETMVESVTATGIYTQLSDPKDAFMSGCYFGVVQGYKIGINDGLNLFTRHLPAIYNEIVESNFDMKIDWVKRFKKLILEKEFDIKDYEG